MSDVAVLRAILDLLAHRSPVGMGDVLRIRGIAGDGQARRVLDFGVDRDILRRSSGGGVVRGSSEAIDSLKRGMFGV